MIRITLLFSLSLLLACSSSSDSTKTDTSAPAETFVSDATPEAATTPDVVLEVVPEVTETLPPPGPESRGWKVKRGVVHLHSALSHDGCAPDGYEDNEGPEPSCLAELRAAPCSNDMDFLMMTDHPGYSEQHTFEEMLQYNESEGDEIIFDDQDRPFVNRLTCPAGSPVDSVYIFAGTEGSKHMPLGLAGPIPEKIFQQNYKDESPLEEAQAAAALTREHGGYVYIPHPEEKSISVERIVAVPLDGIEIYNIHANLMTMLESMDNIFAIDNFLPGADNPPDSDLGLLIFLAPVAKDVEKFDAAAAQIRLSHIAATDIHRNVEIPALCPGGIEDSLCEKFADEYPNFAEYAQVGGPVPMADGDRIDSYARSFRWLSNRGLVQDDDPQSIREAIGMGRSFSAFDMFGYPTAFDFYLDGGDAPVEMGEETTFSDGLNLHFNTPLLTAAPWRADADWPYAEAEVICHLIRADADGSTTVMDATGQGEQATFSVDAPGAYRVFCEITPHHVKAVLPGLEELAVKTYPYIYSNAVFVR